MRAAILVTALLVLLASCSKQTPDSPEALPRGLVQQLQLSKSENEDCLQAAHRFLAQRATLLRCGHFSDVAHLEAVVAIRVPGLADDADRVPISKLKILRRANAEWETVLNVDPNNEITNGAGYVGIDFIDDSRRFPYYRVEFSPQWGSRGPSEFTLVLVPVNQEGKADADDTGTAIGWNPAVGRFQEIEPNGEEFTPEVKSPKHIHSSK